MGLLNCTDSKIVEKDVFEFFSSLCSSHYSRVIIDFLFIYFKSKISKIYNILIKAMQFLLNSMVRELKIYSTQRIPLVCDSFTLKNIEYIDRKLSNTFFRFYWQNIFLIRIRKNRTERIDWRQKTLIKVYLLYISSVCLHLKY